MHPMPWGVYPLDLGRVPTFGPFTRMALNGYYVNSRDNTLILLALGRHT
jgi:hypothetical protein